MEGEGEHLLAEVEKETDPISEEKEVALGVVVEAHTEVASHRGNFKTLKGPLWLLLWRRTLELTPSLHFALVSMLPERP